MLKMRITKLLNPEISFLFLFLALFPFGQLLRINILQPIDLVVGLGALYAFIKKYKAPEHFRFLKLFLISALVSWLFSIALFPEIRILYGLLYLLRLAAYFYFYIYVSGYANKFKAERDLVYSLLSLSVVSAFLGWIQFFAFPDLKPLFIWNWDMHLYRLAGTFLDPVFLGLIIVFGIFITIDLYFKNKNIKVAVLGAFLLISLLFTYSRASYLALFAGLIVFSVYKRKIKELIFVAIVFTALAMMLPTTRNKSIELFRSFSAIARIENYKSTLKVFAKSPVFGIGYDNLCLANRKFIGYQKFESHACSGSDSSLLFILATTGISGLIIFIYSGINLIRSVITPQNKMIILSSVAALMIHSIFSNSLVYPWILGYLLILIAAVGGKGVIR